MYVLVLIPNHVNPILDAMLPSAAQPPYELMRQILPGSRFHFQPLMYYAKWEDLNTLRQIELSVIYHYSGLYHKILLTYYDLSHVTSHTTFRILGVVSLIPHGQSLTLMNKDTYIMI